MRCGAASRASGLPRLLRLLAGLLPAAILLGACGIPTDSAPQKLSRSSVPFGLLAPSAPITTATTLPSTLEVPVQIFLVAPDGHLAAVTRDVPFPAPLSAVLSALVAGPTAPEAASGLETAIPSHADVLSANISGGIATINLSSDFSQLVGPTQIQAVAQLVFTATALPAVHGVSFELQGQKIEVPTGSGAEVPGPVDRTAFAALAP